MKKTKQELYEENIKLKKYLNFWVGTNEYDIDIEELEARYKKEKNKMKLMKKIFISLTIIFLCLGCYYAGGIK